MSESTGPTVIGRGIRLEGELTGSDPIEIWGELHGTAGTESRLRVAPGGKVVGELAAEAVVVEGRVDGRISAEKKVELQSACRVTGDLDAKTLGIEEGAYFEGNVKMGGRKD